METTVLRYTVVIRKEGSNYIVDVPALGISDFGRTIDAAKKNVEGAISCHIEGLRKTNTLVPPPDTTVSYISQAEVEVMGNIQFAF